MHVSGLSVRHLGALRALVQHAIGKEELYTRSLCGSLLSEMVARIAKHLVRHALRSTPTCISAEHEAGPRSRLALLCRSLNCILAPQGAWAAYQTDAASTRPHASAGADVVPNSDAVEALWSLALRAHLQLKYSTHLPALSSGELDETHDLRTDISRLSLAQSLCEQLGVVLHPDAHSSFGANIEVSEPTDTRDLRTFTKAPVQHMHDMSLLPRLQLRSSAVFPSIASIQRALHSRIDGSSEALVRFAAPIPDLEAARKSAGAYRSALSSGSVTVPSFSASSNDSTFFATTFGINYSYTRIGGVLCDGVGRCGIEENVEAWTSLVAQAASSMPSPDSFLLSTRESTRAVSGGMLSPSDILSVNVVCKPLQEEAAVLQQMQVLPAVAGKAATLARAHAILTAISPCFDVSLCTPNVRIMNATSACLISRDVRGTKSSDDDVCVEEDEVGDLQVHVPDTALLCGDAGIAVAVANFAWQPMEETLLASLLLPTAKECDESVAGAVAASLSAALIAALTGSPGMLGVAFVCHGGYDLHGLSVGLAHTPLHWEPDQGGWWLVDVSTLTTTSGKDRPVSLPAKSPPLFRHRGAFSVMSGAPHNVFAIVMNAGDASGSASVWVNGIPTGARLLGVDLKRCTTDGPKDASAACVRPVVLLGSRKSSLAKVTIVDLCVSFSMQERCSGGGLYAMKLPSVLSLLVQGGARGIVPPCHLSALSPRPGAAGTVDPDPGAAAARLPARAWTVDSLLGHAFDGVTAAPDALVRFFDGCGEGDAAEPLDADALERRSGAHDRARLLSSLTERAFGPRHRFHIDSRVGVAEALVKAGRPDEALGALREAFADASSALAPQHAVARAYVCVGDAWLLGPRGGAGRGDLGHRWRSAEAWYARALTVLCAHVPGAADRLLSATLRAAARGGLLQDGAREGMVNNVRTGAPQRPPGFGLEGRLRALREGSAVAAHLLPYALLVLDRLLGVLRAQSRDHHAVPLLQLFVQLWRAFPCPAHYSLFLSPQAEAWSARGLDDGPGGCSGAGYGGESPAWWMRSPYVRVFGHAVPHAASLLPACKPLLGRLGLEEELPAHPLFRGPAHARQGGRCTAPWEAVEAWVAGVAAPRDQGPSRDVAVPRGLGLTEADVTGVRTGARAGAPPAAAGAAAGAEAITDAAAATEGAQEGGLLYSWGAARCESRVRLPLAPAAPGSKGAAPECVVDICVARIGPQSGAVTAVTSHGRALAWCDPDAGGGRARMSALGVADSPDCAEPWVAYPLRTLLVGPLRKPPSAPPPPARTPSSPRAPRAPSPPRARAGQAHRGCGLRRGLRAAAGPRGGRLLLGPQRRGRRAGAR